MDMDPNVIPRIPCRFQLLIVAISIIGGLSESAHAETTVTSLLTNSGNTPSRNDLICAPGMLTRGATFPRGDIYLEEGDTLEVACRLNLTKPELKGLSAENIVFKLTKLGQPIPGELMTTTVVNDSTAVFRVTNMNASKPLLGCYVAKPGGELVTICANQVDVGYLPKEVEDFRCIAKDWASLNCTWTKPNNPIFTKYELNNIISKGYRMNCPNQASDKANGTDSCEWNGRSEPHYYQNTETLVLEMKGTNLLSPNGVKWKYKIDHWTIVVPDKPDKIDVKPVSAHEIEVAWSFTLFEHFKAGLIHKVTVCSVDIVNCTVTNFKSVGVPHLIKKLQVPFAYTQYSVEIRMKSQRANDTEEFWSKPAGRFVKTLGKKPDFPPETTTGSFEIVNKYQTRDIYVYWKNLDPHLRNGSDFHYKIQVFENDQLLTGVEPNDLTDSYALFSSLSLESHRFEIQSVNSEGISPESSIVTVPSTTDAPKSPLSVSKLVFTNGTFEVSWRPSHLGGHVDSYTVYICNSSRNLPNQCHVLLGWVEVTGSETQLVIRHLNPNETTYQFTVSANTKGLSSGMVSASCEQIYDKVPGKITDIRADNITSNSINIKWKLDCSYTAVMVKKFRLTFCPLQAVTGSRCSRKEQVIFAPANVTEQKLDNLDPFTKYMITISIVSRVVESQMSDALFISTAEGAPGDPPEVKSVEDKETNTTALIQIKPPQALNGILQRFNITYQSEDSYDFISVSVKDLLLENSSYYYKLTHLESNSNYSVTVTACTVKCSDPSKPIYVMTKAGLTNMRGSPSLAYDDGTILVSWASPDHLGGPIEYFEVAVKKNGEIYDSEEPRTVKYIPDNLEYNEKVHLKCESNTNVSVQVRAVTKIEDEYLYGDWSPEQIFNCFGNSLLLVWILVVGCAVFIIVLLATTGFCRRWRNMKKIVVKIPPGIEHFQQLNGFPNVQRVRQNSGGNPDTFAYGKDNLTYQMQLTSTRPDEVKDFLSSETSIKETEQMDPRQAPLPVCPDGNENLNLEVVGNDGFNFEDGKVPLWLWQATKLTPEELKQPDGDVILDRNRTPPISQKLPTTTTTTSQNISPNLSSDNHPHPPTVDDDTNLPRLSPSPSNPLLYDTLRGACSEEDEEEDQEHYKKLGILTNGGGIVYPNDHSSPTKNDPFKVNISIPATGGFGGGGFYPATSNSPTHVLRIDTSIPPIEPKVPAFVQKSEDGGPDVVPNNSSYVKWNQMKNDPKVGAPYMQVGILLDT